ncbi:MAG: ABC transporter permease [Gammaproteobacteria bacterium]|nr:ABC transporter permease [Gammaproteobacteria bacterium]
MRPSPGSRFRLAWRLLRRDWRAGELRILLSALVIAVTATTAISFFTDRLQQAMVNQSSELLGGDLQLSAPRPIDSRWLDEARVQGLAHTRVLEFPSVVVAGENFQLAGIKAVAEGFPLRGTLRTAWVPYGEEQQADGLPAAGEAWVEARLLPLLGIGVGDTLELGSLTLRVTRVLTFEPGGNGNFASLAPRVLIGHDDLVRAAVVRPGSRVSYQYYFAGDEEALKRFTRWLEPQLEPSQRLMDVREGRPSGGSALDRAEQYLGLASLVAVLLAGVAIAMGARRYSERHFDVTAVMRCLGAAQRDILGLFLPQLLLLGLIGSAAGVAAGYLTQFGLFHLLRELLPAELPAPGMTPVLIGFLTGMTVLAGFALPPVLRLRQVPALRVLRRELAPMPLRGWLVYGAALLAMGLLMWRYTGSAQLTLSVIGGTLLALLILGLFAFGLLRASRSLHRGVGVAWRFGLNNLWRRPVLSVSQILAFGLTLMAMALITLVRGDLLSTWQTSLPDEAPNHFVVNVVPERVDAFRGFLDARQIESAGLYPMVRGRLAEVNGIAIREFVSDEEGGRGALNRELNLTWGDVLPEDNRLVEGEWFSAEDEGRKIVSIEAGLARRMGIALGDELTFSFGSATLTATVTSLRTVQWDSFRPNFFMIFPPGVLDPFPGTWMTSFYLPDERKGELAQMLRQFPAVTVIDLDRIMEQVRRILKQVTLAVEYVLVFVLLAGFAVLYAALQASLDERLYEGALLRTLGASRRQLRAGHLAEYALLGALAGLFAAGGAELTAFILYSQVFELDYAFKWWLWLSLPPIGAVLIGAAGFQGTRRVVRESPLRVLNDL